MLRPTQEPGWQVLEGKDHFRSPYLRVVEEQVSTPSRDKGVKWVVARRPSSAVVAPRTPEGKFLLVRQERVAVQRSLWEFPAGQVEGTLNEAAIRDTALRELGEEAGARCEGELISLGYFFSSAGFTDECSSLFLATNVVPRPEGSRHDADEAISEVGTFSPDELESMIANGEIVDANTLSTYARLQAKGLFR